jgi:hypothetical protein
MTNPQTQPAPFPGWPHPFGSESRLAYSPRRFVLFFVVIGILHAASLSVARLTGTFVAVPNPDHTPAMLQVLAQGYPVSTPVPPGFSYYLAAKVLITRALGVPYWYSKFVIDVIPVAAAALLMLLLGWRLTRNTMLATVAALGLVCAPIFILGVGMEEAGIFFTPFFLFSLWITVRELQRADGPRMPIVFLAGAVMGVSALIRGNSQFILLAIIPVAAAVYRRARGGRGWALALAFIAAFAAGQFVAILPWTLVQRAHGGDGIATMPTVYKSYFDSFKRHRGNPVADTLLRHYDDPERSLGGVLAFNAEWLRRDPTALAGLYLRKFAKAWYMSDSGRWDVPTLLLHLPYWLLALAGIWKWRRRERRDPAWLLLLAVIVYMWSVSAVMAGIARYSAPLYGCIALFAGVALLPLLERLRRTTPART